MGGRFQNTALIAKLLVVLHRWRRAPYFCGFLGIDSCGLVQDYYMALQGANIFSEVTLVAAQPFSKLQMGFFFKQIKPWYPFPKDLQHGIMEYSSRVLGVFESMIRFTFELKKWHFTWHDWAPWMLIWGYCNSFRSQNSKRIESSQRVGMTASGFHSSERRDADRE